MKTVLITGTTSGIGYALSKCFAEKHYNLVLVSRDSDKLALQKRELEKYGVSIFTISKDLSKKGSALEIYQETKNENLVISILVNNAGFNECGLFTDTTLEKELEMLQVHILTLTELTKYYVIDMVNQRDGHVLNIGSIGSFSPFPVNAVYSASKAYVLSFSKAISSELRGTGVNVTTLCPGATKTEFAMKAKIEHTLLFKIFVMTSDKVAKAGYNALIKRKRVVVVGLYNKLMVMSMKILPYFITARLSFLFLK